MPDSIYQLRDRDLIVVCLLALLAIGVVMVQSAAMNLAPAAGGPPPLWNWTGRGTRHALYAALAALTFVTATRLDYRRLRGATALRSPAAWALAGAALLCLLVLIPGVGTAVNGSRRWLSLGPATVQPSELAKWATVLFLADRLSRADAGSLRRGFAPNAAAVGVVCLLVVIEDFGTAALIAASAFCLFLVGPVRGRHLAVVTPPALLAGFWFVRSEPYRWRRITSFLDPWAAPETDGYHVIQSLYSFASGGWTGRGLGNGVQKLGYLPEDTTDFIFAVIGEELGLFGCAFVTLAYVALLLAGLGAARRCGEPFGRLLATGAVVTLGLQAAVNIAVATASVPTKGMALPLVSAGGSGLVATAFMLGLVYAVARDGRERGEEPPVVSGGPAA